MTTTVTAAILCYNQRDTITQTLDSIASQETSHPYQILIADDASTDGTRELCEAFVGTRPDRASILPVQHNMGIAMNFERLLRACRTDYIALCEGDDYWLTPDKIEIQASFLDDNADVSMVFTDSLDFNEMHPERTRTRRWRDEGIPSKFSLAFLLRRNWFIRTPSIMIRRDVVDALPGYFSKLYSTDYFLHITASKVGAVAHVQSPPTAAYRINAGGISHRGNAARFAWRKVAYLHRIPGIALRSRSPVVAAAAMVHVAHQLKSCAREALQPLSRRPRF